MSNKSIIDPKDQAKSFFDTHQTDLMNSLQSTEVSPDRLRSAFVNAVIRTPELLDADSGSLLSALLNCSADGLIPDDREATIQIYNTKVTVKGGPDKWIKKAQYMPMVQGIRKRARELAGIDAIDAACVYENDDFDYAEGDNPFLTHKPARLGQDRGKIIGVYAIFRGSDRSIIHREVMDRATIDQIRKASKSPDSPAWKYWFSEMARKCPVRRGSKSVPSLPDSLRQIIERGDEDFDFNRSSSPATIDHNPLVSGGSHTANRNTLPSPDSQPLSSGVDLEQGEVVGRERAAPRTEKSASRPTAAKKDHTSNGTTFGSKAHIQYIRELHSALSSASDDKQLDAVLRTYRDEGQAPTKGDPVYEAYGKIALAHRNRVKGQVSTADVEKTLEEVLK